MTKSYEIGGKNYEQRPLVLGQIRQLLAVCAGLSFDPAAGTAGIIAALGDKLHLVLAVVLVPEGVTLRDKKIDELAANLEFDIDLPLAVQMVEDFFDCNPIASILEKVKGAFGKIKTRISTVTGSSSSASSSQEEISPEETSSSGDSPLPSADLTSDHAAGT